MTVLVMSSRLTDDGLCPNCGGASDEHGWAIIVTDGVPQAMYACASCSETLEICDTETLLDAYGVPQLP